MLYLSKSKILALRRCPKRLCLQFHRPDFEENEKSLDKVFHDLDILPEIKSTRYHPHPSPRRELLTCLPKPSPARSADAAAAVRFEIKFIREFQRTKSRDALLRQHSPTK